MEIAKPPIRPLLSLALSLPLGRSSSSSGFAKLNPSQHRRRSSGSGFANLNPSQHRRRSSSSSENVNARLCCRRPRMMVIMAAVKKTKELSFDNIIQDKKKLKLARRIINVLAKQPGRTMPLRELGKHRRDIRIQHGRRLVALLAKFPGVFQVVAKGSVNALYVRLTPEADAVIAGEERLRAEESQGGGVLVTKLRKLLMMSLQKQLPLEKIGHLRTDLGLPQDFRTGLCRCHPEYFRVVESEKEGPVLELTAWDTALAVPAAEIGRERKRLLEAQQRNLILERPQPKFERALLPKGVVLKQRDRQRILDFMKMPDISPYEDFSNINPSSMEAEKHACAVVHELLSLTLEKRILVDHLTHFRDYYRFSQRIRAMLIRHPELFYVSFKGDRDSVFLREAYHNSQLMDKDPLVLCDEKLQALVNFGRFRRRSRTAAGDQTLTENAGINGSAEVIQMTRQDEADADVDVSEDEDFDYDSAEDFDYDGGEWSEIEEHIDEEKAFFSRKADKVEILRQAARRDAFPKIPCDEPAMAASSNRPRERW